MADWLPWALVFMIGIFGTLWTLLQALSEETASEVDLSTSRSWLVGTIVASFAVYALHLILGEAWLPY